MDQIVVELLVGLLGVLKVHPVVATVLGVVTTVATVVVALQGPIGRFVRRTKTTKDDGVWRWVHLFANAITPNGSRMGEGAEKVEPPKPKPKPNPETHELPVRDETPTEN